MGLLVDGEPLPPEDLKVYLKYIREHGIRQFLQTWNRLKDLQNDELKFGDEIECGIFTLDDTAKTVKIALRGAEVN
jgi:glutamate--cysteine ligase catalytic subunit